MSPSKKTFIPVWAILLAFVATPKLLANSLSSIVAQSPTPDFTLPESLPQEAAVTLSGTSSMTTLNEALKQRYEERFPNAEVQLQTGNSDEALEALQQGEVDIAAVGRPLTDAEKAAGLEAVPIDRGKIAIIVGPDNPFNENLTFEQFAGIFRGEITDWSEVGGEPGPIRLVDRPEFSDTRRALSTYDVFKTAPFETGNTAEQVSEDETETVIQALGTDGISYAIADQVVGADNVNILSMHQTLPDDPRYPYSQIRTYVYQTENATPATLAFLGFATSEPGQEVIAAVTPLNTDAAATTPETNTDTATTPGLVVPPGGTTATPTPQALADSPATVPNPNEVTETETAFVPDVGTTTAPTDGGFPWWLLWLLAIPVLGGLLWWLLKGRGELGGVTSIPPATGTTTTPPATGTTGVTPATGVASPGVSPSPVTGTGSGGTAPTLASPDGNVAPPNPAATLPITSSPANLNLGTAAGIAGAVGATGAAMGAFAWATRPLQSRITLSRQAPQSVYSVWNVSPADIDAAKQQGGQQRQLRVYDVTGIDLDTDTLDNVQQFDCDEATDQLSVEVPQRDRSYISEVGYVTGDNQWLALCRSNSVYIPAETETEIGSTTPGIDTIDTVETNTPDLQEPTLAHPGLSVNSPGIDTVETNTPEVNQIPDDTQTPETELGLTTPGVDAADINIPDTQEPTLADPGLSVNSPDLDTPDLDQTPETEIGLTTPGVDVGGIDTPEVDSIPDDDDDDTQIPDTQTPLTGVGLPAIALGGAAITGAAIPILASRQNQLHLTPAEGQTVVANWEVSQTDIDAVKQQGGQQLQLRVYDVTGIDLDTDAPHSMQSWDCDESSDRLSVEVVSRNRDYAAAIGYVTGDNQWLPLCRSNSVYVPASTNSDNIEDSTPPITAVEQPTLTDSEYSTDSPITPVENPTLTDSEYSIDSPATNVEEPTLIETDLGYGMIPPGVDLEETSFPAVENPTLTDLEDDIDSPVTDLNEPILTDLGYGATTNVENPTLTDSEYSTDSPATNLDQPTLTETDSEYDTDSSVIETLTDSEINQTTNVENPTLTDSEDSTDSPVANVEESTLTDSEINNPTTNVEEPTLTDLGYGVTSSEIETVETVEDETPYSSVDASIMALGGAAIAGSAIPIVGQTPTRLHLTPGSNQTVVADWNIAPDDAEMLKQQGGQQLQLRVYDVTDVDIETDMPHSMQQFNCDELTEQVQVAVPYGDRDYAAAIGYVTTDNQWLPLCCSEAVYISTATDINSDSISPAIEVGESDIVELEETTLTDTQLDTITTVEDPTETDSEYDITSAAINVDQPTDTDTDIDSGYGTDSPAMETEAAIEDETPYSSVDASTMALAGAALGGAAIAFFGSAPTQLRLTPGSNQTVIADWNIAPDDAEMLKQQGGQQLQLRVYNVTDVDIETEMPHSMQQFDCDELTEQVQFAVAEEGCNYIEQRCSYIAEVGYVTLDNQWLRLCRSNLISIPVIYADEQENELGETETFSDTTTVSVVTPPPSRLDLTVTGDQTVKASWDVPQTDIEAVKQQGGQQFQLRVYDVTDVDLHTQDLDTVQQYECDQSIEELQVSVPYGDRNYAAAIGYLADEDRWFPLCCSDTVYVPALQALNVESSETTLAADEATTGAGLAGMALGGVAATLGTTSDAETTLGEQTIPGSCEIQHLSVDSRRHCFRLSSEEMSALQDTAITHVLEPGIKIIRIKSGAFGYSANDSNREPFVLLWISGGKFINKKTNIPVNSTWSSLNGYAETLTLEVLEQTTLSAFFFDTNPEDNEGTVTLSVVQLER
ncbi:MAG: DUF4912 domain-containing protein [Microcoleaceae cyanobacterium]